MTREEALQKVHALYSVKYIAPADALVCSLEALGVLTLDVAFKPTPAELKARDVFTEWSLPGNDIIRDLRRAGLEIVERKS